MFLNNNFKKERKKEIMQPAKVLNSGHQQTLYLFQQQYLKTFHPTSPKVHPCLLQPDFLEAKTEIYIKVENIKIAKKIIFWF